MKGNFRLGLPVGYAQVMVILSPGPPLSDENCMRWFSDQYNIKMGIGEGDTFMRFDYILVSRAIKMSTKLSLIITEFSFCNLKNLVCRLLLKELSFDAQDLRGLYPMRPTLYIVLILIQTFFVAFNHPQNHLKYGGRQCKKYI